jgi:glycosyltransferase involved in cell wall biosynthesis
MIPSYNHARYLPAAIESVLSQTLEDLELIVADDGSTDGSLEIARRYAEAEPRIRVMTHPGHENRGIGATGNLLRPASRGRYLFGLPSDDLLYPDTLEREVAFLEDHPQVGFVYGEAHLVDADGRPVEVQGLRGPEVVTLGADITAGGRIVERLVQGNGVAAMTVMWRRECLLGVGEEHPGLMYSDWELQTRAAARWEVAFIPRPLAMYRVHGANTGKGNPRAIRLERQYAVTEVLRERAPSVGGRLAEPRVRAALELQMGYLRFAVGEPGGEADMRAAFERDPSLARDARWLADWLWSRPLDELLPDDGRDFVRWADRAIRPLLEPRAALTMRREASAARAEARAIRLARRDGPLGAILAWLVAVAQSPRRLRDRRLIVVLLDAMVGTGWGRALRRLKRIVHRRLASGLTGRA